MFKFDPAQRVNCLIPFNLLFVAMVMGASMIVAPSIGEASLTATSGDLVSYWDCEETSGTRVDSHGNNDLTDNNTVGYVTGVIGNACDFEEDNSEYLSITDASQTGLDFQGDWTINLWLDIESPAVMGLVQKFRWTGAVREGVKLHTNDTQTDIKIEGQNSAGFENAFDTNLNITNDYMLTLTYDGSGTFNLYEDATLVSSYSSGSGGITDNAQPFYIGAYYWTSLSNYFDGHMDEISYWQVDLTADDITALYNSDAGLGYDDLFSVTSTTSTSTATSTDLSVDELVWVLELYLSLFAFLIFTYLGYRFTKLFI